ncbi:hypothetical protein GOP47_0025924 [Adiantum capillus-veneris]|uniref:Uncharacterized protein n=1 Tax=Adiantum capillus-veneris TaxID=13818 RepID=A0A9D4Z3B0_ADICA|nr:hypothetical protein GOP47_0031216 [Adiantum capillus-veneris]KAI5059605.1 hypothetical protein GOP47_0025924 [Adiantum capillus-veneris]
MASIEATKSKKTSSYFLFFKEHGELIKACLEDANLFVSVPALIKASVSYGDLFVSALTLTKSLNELFVLVLALTKACECPTPSFSLQVEMIEPANAQVEEKCMATYEAKDAHDNEKDEGNGLTGSGNSHSLLQE